MRVHTVYLYGCVACRNVGVPGFLRRTVSSPGTVALERPDSADRVRSSRWQRLHAAIDTVELSLRLHLACRRAGRTARQERCDVLVLTDRTPLDALVKHDLPEHSWTAQRLQTLGGRYAAIALLDAGSDVLAARDGEHAAAGLERARDTYRRRSGRMAGVRTVSTQATSSDGLAREVLDHVLARGAGSARTPETANYPAADSSA
jgi:hypothetical protein